LILNTLFASAAIVNYNSNKYDRWIVFFIF